jgi:type I restriction enzyme S subunit
MTTSISHLKPYPAYIPSGVDWLGDIPAHWEVRRLKYLASVNDEALPETTDPEMEITYVDIGNVDSVEGIKGTEDLLFEDAPSRARRIARQGDVIISTVRTYLKAIARIEPTDANLIVSTGFAVIRPRGLDSGFAAYSLSSPYFVDRVVAHSVGVSYPAINASELGCLDVAFPPLPDQRAIASFLDRETARIDALVSKNERLIELLQEKRTALITRAVTKGIDLDAPMKDSGVEWLGEIPVHWDVKRLKEVGEALISLTYSPNDVVGQKEGSLVLRASNISEGKIVLEDNVYVGCPVPAKLITREGDILICSRSGSRGLIGKNAIIDSDSSGMTFGAFMTVYRSIHNEYLHQVFNSALFEFQSGMFMTSTINQLTLGMLNGFHVPVPPTTEQTAIAAFLDGETAKLDSLIAKVREAIEHLRELRSALISAAVTGRIDVREEAGCK